MRDQIMDQSSIDWELSIKLANNNKQLAKDLLGMFVEALPASVEAIHQSMEKQHYHELVNEVHKLHGASCYCGTSRLKDILSQMETVLREKKYPHFEQMLTHFDEEVENILSAYKVIDLN